MTTVSSLGLTSARFGLTSHDLIKGKKVKLNPTDKFTQEIISVSKPKLNTYYPGHANEYNVVLNKPVTFFGYKLFSVPKKHTWEFYLHGQALDPKVQDAIVV